MKVQDVMTSPARSCAPDATLVNAVQTLWDHDCGALPVLDSDGRPVGMITDRDICMALARKNRFPGDIRVREVMSPHPFVCRPSDEVEEALQTMALRRVRRLPVVDVSGCLVGIISVSDVAAGASEGRAAARGSAEIHRTVVEALLAICQPAKGSSKKSA
ncbi:MAG TPA: CBS domain-containing protein [Thermoanaerobaculia bacterium]|nr:CBS domain-containing protein [Thermoanaerobaculia bacterium]